MNRIRELREERNIDQKVLAMDLGVSQPTISDWESGRKKPSSKNIVKLANYFSVSIDYLLGRAEEMNYPAPKKKSTAQRDGKCDCVAPELRVLCQQLSPAGQKKLADYASDLIASGQYANSRPAEFAGKDA